MVSRVLKRSSTDDVHDCLNSDPESQGRRQLLDNQILLPEN